jgi:hypothetical protein
VSTRIDRAREVLSKLDLLKTYLSEYENRVEFFLEGGPDPDDDPNAPTITVTRAAPSPIAEDVMGDSAREQQANAKRVIARVPETARKWFKANPTLIVSAEEFMRAAKVEAPVDSVKAKLNMLAREKELFRPVKAKYRLAQAGDYPEGSEQGDSDEDE